ncbi:lipocalin family protein [Flavobacterium sp. J27]|uniref:lipocalin family protein n=1 Tax=Flavobacterium sp. J27 TaxID=2060419 RepID=UPI001032780E|nr:lipocalin family protein [Flavobacterium sp. J27]
MKKLTIASVLLLSLCLASFSEVTSKEVTVIGKWKYYQEGKKVSKAELLFSYEHLEKCGNDYVEFFEDGKVNDVFYYGADNCEMSVDSGTWKKVDNNLIINFPYAGEEKGEILLLDATTLKIKATVEGKEIIYIYKKI